MPATPPSMRTALALAIAACAACTSVRLDMPMQYRDVPPAERIQVACYYSLDSATEAAELSSVVSGLKAELGPGVAEQMRVALLGLCRGSQRAKDRDEFRRLAAGKPAVLFEVHAEGEMSPATRAGAESTGSIVGRALLIGTSGGEPLQYAFSGRGAQTQNWGSESTGGEGLRRALQQAVQRLVDEARRDRARIHQLAGL